MIIYTKRKHKTLVLTVGIAPARSVKDERPQMGMIEEVNEAWRQVENRFKVKRNKRPLRTTSDCPVNLPTAYQRKDSDLGKTLAKFQRLSEGEGEATTDVYSKHWVRPHYDKKDTNYGRPPAGSLTEQRGIAAGNYIGKEILRLCDVIFENGTVNSDSSTDIPFGDLFYNYVYISDKVVGLLLRARKYGIVEFEGEMLYQRRDDAVPIRLLYTPKVVRSMLQTSNDPQSVFQLVSSTGGPKKSRNPKNM